jgi:predicted enzyme related to lactoylglutathione lyase
MGTYQVFATGAGPVGGMMTKTADLPAPTWMYYFNVAAMDAAVDRVKAGGGQILMGPHQVPGDQWIVQGLDPQGAMFALLSSVR